MFDPIYVDSVSEGIRQSLPWLFAMVVAPLFWMSVKAFNKGKQQ